MIIFKPGTEHLQSGSGYFIFTVIKYLGTPVRMLPLFWDPHIHKAAVHPEISKAMGIFQEEVSRYPVQNNADAFLCR